MNDAEALDAINEALAHWFKGDESEFSTLRRIAHITGLNAGAKK